MNYRFCQHMVKYSVNIKKLLLISKCTRFRSFIHHQKITRDFTNITYYTSK